MAENSGIQWTTHTFNPWVGCDRISPGCDNCYAESYDRRVGGGVDPEDGVKKSRWGKDAPRPATSAANWRKPVKWNAEAAGSQLPTFVFCASLADVFELTPKVWEARQRLLRLIMETPALTWQLLTKRPKNIIPILQAHERAARQRDVELQNWLSAWLDGIPPRNVWGGTTVEDQLRAAQRVVPLQRAPFYRRFLSLEPLIGPVRLEHAIDFTLQRDRGAIHWAIIGGESGGNARPFDLSWAGNLVSECSDLQIARFMKQMGSRPVQYGSRLKFEDHHGGDASEWPLTPALQRWPREFPSEGM